MSAASPAGVVERMLEHASHGRWDQMETVLSPDFEIAEPESLPYGGIHRGVDGYIALMKQIGALFELSFEPDRLDALGDTTVVLQMHVTFTAHATGRRTRLPVLELLTVDRDRVKRSEVYLHDTAALLATLRPLDSDPPALSR